MHPQVAGHAVGMPIIRRGIRRGTSRVRWYQKRLIGMVQQPTGTLLGTHAHHRSGGIRSIRRGPLVPGEAHWHASQVKYDTLLLGAHRQKRHRCQKRLIGTRRVIVPTLVGGLLHLPLQILAVGMRAQMHFASQRPSRGEASLRGVGQPRLWPSPWGGTLAARTTSASRHRLAAQVE
jgi:hypothetical protein